MDSGNAAACPNPAAAPVGHGGWSGLIWRIIRIPVTVLLVAGSLLAFPAVLPWVLAGWIAVATGLLWLQKSPLPGLLMASLLILVKHPEGSVSLVVLLACLLSAALWYHRNRGRWSAWPLYLLWLAWAYFWASFHWGATCQTVRGDHSGRQGIVCLGDSLTDSGYPGELAKLVTPPVIDYGRDGITSEDGLELIDEIIALDPRVLVLELGGHDYNQGRSRRETWGNLATIVERCLDRGIHVVMAEVPRGFVRDPFRGIERQLCRQFDLTLVADTPIRKFILFSPVCPPGIWLPPERHLSHDGLHPNERGNRLFAGTIAGALSDLLGPEILR